MINNNALPIETSHTSLDFFERPQLLVNFDGSFEQKIGPLYAPNGPTLEFEVKGDGTNFIDLQNNYLDQKKIGKNQFFFQFFPNAGTVEENT